MRCLQCEALMINGVFCHETGCPNSHLDANRKPYAKDCLECGDTFQPDAEEPYSIYCSSCSSIPYLEEEPEW